MFLKYFVLIALAAVTLCEDDKKWVWKGGDRRQEERDRISSGGTKPRYEVLEEGPLRPGNFRPPADFDRPGNPFGIHQESGFPNRPYPNRPGPGSFVPNERPGDIDFFGGGNYRPPGNFRPPGGNRPPLGNRPLGGNPPDILTGPVPSWANEPPIKNFDRCKCAEKFNCNSPGISYGQCDVGKQYCCYNSKQNGLQGGPLPSRPIHSPENGVLVGPGGPIDYPNRPQRPYPRPPNYGGNAGVLVGPGGPSGIGGRPPNRPYPGGAGFDDYNRPFDGPFRPLDFGGNPYGYGQRNNGKSDIK